MKRDLYRSLTGKRFITIMAAVMLLCMLTTAAGQAKPYTRKLGAKQWIPNTTIKLSPWESAVAVSENTIWCALTGGLGEYNMQNGHFALYYLGDDDDGSDITSLAVTDDMLWVATRKGIRLFSLRDRSFVQTLTPQNSPLGSENNIYLTADRDTSLLYVTSFENIQRYDLKKKKWESLNHLYDDFSVGEPASRAQCLLNENDVWIGSSAHARSRGGIFRYNRKEKTWSLYRDQITGIKNTKRIDIDDMLLMPQKLFVLAGDRVSRYDAKQNKWENMSPCDYDALSAQLAESYPRIEGHYARDSNCLLSLLARAMAPHIKLTDYAEAYFTGSRIMALNPENITLYDDQGAQAGPFRLTDEPLIFRRALGSDSTSKALFLTNRGLELLDTGTMELMMIKGSESLAEKDRLWDFQSLWNDDTIFLVIKKISEQEIDGASRWARIYTIDMKKGNLQNRTPKEVKWVEELFTLKNNIYCYTDKSLMVWKNGIFTATREKIQWTAPPISPPSHRTLYTLKNGKKVEFTPRGVYVY